MKMGLVAKIRWRCPLVGSRNNIMCCGLFLEWDFVLIPGMKVVRL